MSAVKTPRETVLAAALKSKMTEADFFKAVYAHEGTYDDTWVSAYDSWAASESVPHNGYHHWFLEVCQGVIDGKIELSPQFPTPAGQMDFGDGTACNDGEDDGN